MKLLLLISFMSINSIYSQDLMKETIRYFTNKNQSIYFEKGVFHNGGEKKPATLREVRHFYHKKDKRERIVFDFVGKTVPRVYGYIDKKEKKIYIDFFKTNTSNLKITGTGELIKSINFYPIQKDILSLEISLKTKVNLNIFYIDGSNKSIAKLVLDIKK